MMSGIVKTWDGINLHYWQSGPDSGSNILLIPGWSQTAEEWKYQVENFQKEYRVTTYDHRGHGESDKPDRGYRISRLASDLNDLITQLDLSEVTLVVHSMGCAVTWCYWDTFADSRKRVSKIVLVDEPTCLVANPILTPEESTKVGSPITTAMAFDTVNGLRGPDAGIVSSGFLRSLFSPTVEPAVVEWALKENAKMSHEHAATLLLTITVPTLVVGGKGSFVPFQGMEWIASQIKGSRCKIFEIDEGGSHFVFVENAHGFNAVLEEFLQTS
jgi:non-heme chloroperoxidase